jgi:hypothetical protein
MALLSCLKQTREDICEELKSRGTQANRNLGGDSMKWVSPRPLLSKLYLAQFWTLQAKGSSASETSLCNGQTLAGTLRCGK